MTDTEQFSAVARLTASASSDHSNAVDLSAVLSEVGDFYVRMVYRNVADDVAMPAIQQVDWYFDNVVFSTQAEIVWDPWNVDGRPDFGGFLYAQEPIHLDGAEHELIVITFFKDGSHSEIRAQFGPPPPPYLHPMAEALIAAGASQETAGLLIQAADGALLSEEDSTTLLNGLDAVDPTKLSVDDLGLVADIAVAVRTRYDAAAQAIERDVARLRGAISG